MFQRRSSVDMTQRRGTTSNQHWKNDVDFNVRIYKVEQRWIRVFYFNFDFNNVRQLQKKRCHFQRRFSQRWATSKQRREYDHLWEIKRINLASRRKSYFFASNKNHLTWIRWTRCPLQLDVSMSSWTRCPFFNFERKMSKKRPT